MATQFEHSEMCSWRMEESTRSHWRKKEARASWRWRDYGASTQWLLRRYLDRPAVPGVEVEADSNGSTLRHFGIWSFPDVGLSESNCYRPRWHTGLVSATGRSGVCCANRTTIQSINQSRLVWFQASRKQRSSRLLQRSSNRHSRPILGQYQ